ncbi:MAG: primosomal protein N' [bacterium]|nr:primosomal protein N' [bacterium]
MSERILEISESARAGLADDSLWTFVKTRSAQRLIRELRDCGENGMPRHHVMRGASKQRRQALEDLLTRGIICERKEVLSRWRPDDLPALPEEPRAPLTRFQQLAFLDIKAALDAATYRGFLLYGVTGSGKTRVYIDAIKHALAAGRTALVLVPEISLTPILWGRFRAAFGEAVAIQHSAQPAGHRYDLWRDIARGKYRIVIGARSAVFSPLANLGLVVVDEEHEASYKQTESSPRYSSRDAALFRARQANAVAILGSATPTLESLYAVEQQRLTLLTLPERIGTATLPHIEVVLPDQESSPEGNPQTVAVAAESSDGDEDQVLSSTVRAAIKQAIADGKQAIVLQNRRGFAPFLICRTCGKLFECPNCSVSLTYHRPGRVLQCHYCHHRDDAPDLCPACGSDDLSMCGSGTQRVAEELSTVFPSARIARMDSDAMARMGAHGQLMARFAAGDFDILVGTQMVAKGLDFPRVELAVVADADTELFYPDFRASERGASLLVQLAGRAGRASNTGRVLLQSRAHDHASIRATLAGDWLNFAKAELEHRDRGGFPPYTRIVLLRAIAADEDEVARAMLYCKRYLEQHKQIGLLGPSPCAVKKIKNRIRYQLLARTARSADPSGAVLRAAIRAMFEDDRNSKHLARVQWEVDVDPATTS